MKDARTTGRLRLLRFAELWRFSLLMAVTALAATQVRAHNLGDSYLYLQIYENSVSGRFEIALSDLNAALGLTGTDLEITADTLDERSAFLKDYYLAHVSISGDEGPLPIRFREHDLLAARGGYVLLPFDFEGLDRVPETLTIDYSVLFDEDPEHRGFLLVEHNWATGTFANENRISLVFSPDSRRQVFDLRSSGRLRGFLAVVDLGAEHIWMGLDHLMFLIALLLPSVLRRDDGRWSAIDRSRPVLWNVVKIVTAILAAHLVALGLAALGVVRFPERLVEVVIAASIAVAAADMLFPLFRKRLWPIVFGLSLFHGLGLAEALLGLGVLDEHLGLSLFAFNLGVQISHVVVVVVLVPIMFLVRRLKLYGQLILPVAAVAMILVSGIWVVERAFDFDIPLRELLPVTVQKVIP